MSESLRDQLLKSGLARPNKPETRSPKPQPRPGQRPPQRPPQAGNGPRSRPAEPARREQSEIDLAKAYALRDKTERDARANEQRIAEQRAREKKERKQKLTVLLSGKSLNEASAEIPRHFPHTNKIRRIYVTTEQLAHLNAGELGVTQFAGRYLLVSRETALAAQAIDAEALVLLCDPNAVDDDGVPADLVW